VLGLGAVIYALTAGAASGWLSAPVLITAAAGVVSLTVLVPVEPRQRAPMLRLSLFASRQFNAINITTVLFYGALGAASYLLVLQCELRLGYSAAQAVAVLIPESAVFLVISPLSGTLAARTGPLRRDDPSRDRAVGPRSRLGRDSPGRGGPRRGHRRRPWRGIRRQ
jgi:hypothetical protein